MNSAAAVAKWSMTCAVEGTSPLRMGRKWCVCGLATTGDHAAAREVLRLAANTNVHLASLGFLRTVNPRLTSLISSSLTTYRCLGFSGLPIATKKMALLPFACGEKNLITSSSKKVSPVPPRRWAYAAK